MSLLIVPLLYPDLAGLLNLSHPFQRNFLVAAPGRWPDQSTLAFVGTNPTDESTVSDLRVVRQLFIRCYVRS
jgi:hypothetical protein